jgi:SAM-dependent methyltransferase
MQSNASAWTANNVEGRWPKDFVPPAWPHEPMVKVFSSRKVSPLGSRFLDMEAPLVFEVGCMHATALRFFHERSARISGSEVTQDMVDRTIANCRRFGIKDAKISIGHNRSIPAADNSVDVLVSINTIHYDVGGDVRDALREFRRVLKPSGVAFIETTGADHFVRKNAVRLKALTWKPGPFFGDFRDGGTFGMFDDLAHYESELKDVFSSVEVGRSLEQYSTRTLDFYFAVVAK